MAGAMTVDQAITYCHNMAAGKNYRVPLKVCTQVMLSGVRKCFHQQQSPDGRSWAPLSSATVANRRTGQGPARRGVQILRDRGTLMASTTANMAAGAVRVLTDRVSVVGSNLIYARIHQDGGRIAVTPKMRAFLHWRGIHLKKDTTHVVIPARPYIGHRPENMRPGGTYDKVFLEYESKRAAGDGKG